MARVYHGPTVPAARATEPHATAPGRDSTVESRYLSIDQANKAPHSWPVSVVEEVVFENSSGLVAHVGHFVVVIGRSELTLENVHAFEKASDNATARYATFGHLIVLPASLGPPASDIRQALAQVARRHRRSIAAVALVSKGSGMRARLHRATVSLIQATSGAKHPSRVFEDIGLATAWLDGHVPRGSKADGAVLRQAVERLQFQS